MTTAFSTCVATARAALAIADQAGVSHMTLYYAMLNGASDATPGDRAFAGVVYAIARRERLGVAAHILGGRVKVDQVPPSYLPRDAEGLYQPEATRTGRKGDTIYLPSDMDFTSLIAQAFVVHELTHPEADATATSLQTVPVLDAELPALRAEAAFLIRTIKTRAGADRQKAVQEITKEIRLPILYCMLLEATEVIDHDALAVVEELHAAIVGGSGDPATAVAFPPQDFRRFVRGLLNEERHADFFVALEERARAATTRAYKDQQPAQDGGLAGESALDTPIVRPAGATLQRQPRNRTRRR